MNKGAFEHEAEVLLYDGADYQVASVQDEEYDLYEVNRRVNYFGGICGSGTVLKKGDKVFITNNKKDCYG